MKKNIFKYTISLIIGYISLYFAMFGTSELIKGYLFVVFTGIAYIGSFLVLYWQIMICKHNDISYENIRKVEKLFS